MHALAWYAEFHPALGEPIWSADPPAYALLLAVAAGALGGIGHTLLVDRNRGGWALVLLLVVMAPTLVGPLYEPSDGARWITQAIRTQGFASKPVQVAGWSFGAAWFVATVAMAVLTKPEPREPSGSHGSAAWGEGSELAEAETGALIGRGRARTRALARRRRKPGPLLRYDGPGHLLTVAPTRAGKGVGAVVPNLLNHGGSVVVTDPKGENYALTTAHRRQRLGQRVVGLDPFGLAGRLGLPEAEREAASGALNPLDLIDSASPDAADDAAMIADMLVVPQKGGAEGSFWDDEAKALLAGLVLYVALTRVGAERSLPHVRELLTLAPEAFDDLLVTMGGHPNATVRRTSNRLRQKADRERSGVVSSAQSHTHFLDSPRMARVLGESTFDPADLARGGLSVYLMVPPDRLDTFSRWLRLVVATSLVAVTRSRPVTVGGGAGEGRVLFLLDEFAQLGPMAPVRRAVSLMAGYGVQVWPFLQDLGQLKQTYPKDWETFVANTDVVQAFGTTDQFTAEYLSKMTGTQTVFSHGATTGRSRSRGKSRSSGRSEGSSMSEHGRPLLMPDELRLMGDDEQLLLVRGQRPIRCRKLRFYEDAEFNGLLA
jgi:type IV secretion system protein VirD4